MSDNTPTGAELDALIEADLKTASASQGPQTDRQHVLHLVCNAYAGCIADDVAAGREPWHITVAKYRRGRELFTAMMNAAAEARKAAKAGRA